jgi:hypothetical protein
MKGKELSEERRFRRLSRLFETRGIEVRRERLSRGPAFRVKSGSCMLSGKDLIFIDQRLPIDQQFAVLKDYLETYNFELTSEERGELSLAN